MVILLLRPESLREFVKTLEMPHHIAATDRSIALAASRTTQQQSSSTAILSVQGVIDYRASILSDLGFVVSSESLRGEFSRLMQDDSISRIVFDIDSPGGLYSGLPELAKDVFNSRGSKQTIAVANPTAASGALWLGAAAEKFFMIGSGNVGSIGALMLHTDFSEAFAREGIVNTILRSPEAKADFNSLEPLSEESREHHQAQIEAIADEFTGAMAKFRGVSKAAVREKFGQGRMLNAADAVSAGLVDGLVSSVQDVMGKVRSTSRVKLHPRLELARRLKNPV